LSNSSTANSLSNDQLSDDESGRIDLDYEDALAFLESGELQDAMYSLQVSYESGNNETVKIFNQILFKNYGNIEWKSRGEVQRQIEELPNRIASSVDFVNAVKNGDRQVAQITFNDDIINIVAGMLEEKTEFVQTYFANQDFQNFVNARVFEAAIHRLSAM
jgi:hypothetical protein